MIVHPVHDMGANFEPPDGPAATASAYTVRAFGTSRCDLDIDLSDENRPALVTRLLLACLDGLQTMPDAENVVWEWTVAERLQYLLAIAIATQSVPPALNTRCQARDCRIAMQVELDLAAFIAELPPDPVVCRVAGRRVTARLPRGADQRLWRDAKTDIAWLARQLIETVDGQIPERDWGVPTAWIDEFGAALAAQDPHTVLQLSATCPSCGHANPVDFDLEDHILRLFADVQRRLIDDVHGLATAYRWSEVDICALPTWRRRAYLARVVREVQR